MPERMNDAWVKVMYYISELIIVASIYHIAEGFQIISVGALRGIRDVNVPAIIILISFWVLGVPFGAYLAFFAEIGPIGIWIGTATGMSIAAILLAMRLIKKGLISDKWLSVIQVRFLSPKKSLN